MHAKALLAIGALAIGVAACGPTLPPPPEPLPDAPTSWEDGPDSCWTVTGCPPCQSNSMNDCLPPGATIPVDNEVTCLALGCPGQPPELPGDGPITP